MYVVRMHVSTNGVRAYVVRMDVVRTNVVGTCVVRMDIVPTNIVRTYVVRMDVARTNGILMISDRTRAVRKKFVQNVQQNQ